MSDIYEDLDNTDVDNNGNIIDDTRRAWSCENQEAAANLKNKRKILKTQQHSVSIKQEKALASSNSILSTGSNKKNLRKLNSSKSIKIVSDETVSNKISITDPTSTSPSQSKHIKNSKRNHINDNDASSSSMKRCKLDNNDRCSPVPSKFTHSPSIPKHRKQLSDITNDRTDTPQPSTSSFQESYTSTKQHRKPLKYDDNICCPSEESDNNEEEITENNLENHRVESGRSVEATEENENESSDKLFFIPNVTLQLIKTQKLLLASMIYSYEKIYGHDAEMENNVTVENAAMVHDPDILYAITKINQITDELFIKTPEKEEIFPNSKCYNDKTILMALNLSNDDSDCWTKFATDILVQIYGKYLKFMSVKGTRGNKAINKKLLKSIYNAINAKREEPISSKVFNLHMNKICSNRKRSMDGSCQEPNRKKTLSTKKKDSRTKKLTKIIQHEDGHSDGQENANKNEKKNDTQQDNLQPDVSSNQHYSTENSDD